MVQSSKTSCAIQHKIPQMSTRFGNLVNFSLDRTTLNSIFQSKSKSTFCSIPLHDVVHQSDRYSLLQLASKKSQETHSWRKKHIYEIAYVEKLSHHDI